MINLKNFYSILKNNPKTVISIVLVGMIVGVYFQVYAFEFVGFDDNEYVYENPHVTTGISLENIIWSFTAFHSNNWHPLTWISHMMDCQVFGLHPGWHHLVNLLFHILNSVLLFLVFSKMTGGLWQSAFIAAVFAIHPLHVESVAWVAERKDVLSAFFWMLTLWGYQAYVKLPGIKRYIGVLLFFTLGLLSKPMLVTLPFVLLLLDYWPLGRIQFQEKQCDFTHCVLSQKNLILEKIPLFILSGVSSVMTFGAQNHGGVVKSFETFPMINRIANAFVSYLSYMGKMIYPENLAFQYPYPENLALWKGTGAVLMVLLITLLAMHLAVKRPYFIVGWLWYLGTLVPVIGLVQVGMQSMADRYMYIPMVGLLMVVSWGVSEFIQRWKTLKTVSAASAMIIIPLLMVVSWKQTGYWATSNKMLEHTLKVTSNNYIAHDTLGVNLFLAGKTDEAIYHYLKAAQIYPKNYYTQFNLGVARFQQGKMDEAIEHYTKAVSLEPNYAKAHCNLGAAFFQKKEYEKAGAHFLKAITIEPDYIDAHFNLGVLYYTDGKMDEAIPCFLKVIEFRPDFANAYYYLGLVFDKKGIADKAVTNFQAALRLQPNSVEILLVLAGELLKQGSFNEAIRYYSDALKLAPDNLVAHHNLGVAFFNLGQVDRAIQHYVKAIKINPNFADGYFNLGGALYTKGNIDGAASCFQQALKIKPDYEEAQRELAKLLNKKKSDS